MATKSNNNHAAHPAAALSHSSSSSRRLAIPILRAFALRKSLFDIDRTQINVLPAVRAASLIVMEWIVIGIGSSSAVAVILGTLFVGLCDPNGGLGKRTRCMALTLLSCVVLGAIPAALLRCGTSKLWNLAVAFGIAFVAGMAPMFGSAGLNTAGKLGAALFAIYNGAWNSNNQCDNPNNDDNDSGGNEYFDSAYPLVIRTATGGLASLLLAILPELLGDRDAVRSDLFRAWNGLGGDLVARKGDYGTPKHYRDAPASAMRSAALEAAVEGDIVEDTQAETLRDPSARDWLLGSLRCVEEIRAGCFCLSNMHRMRKAKTAYNNNHHRFNRASLVGVQEEEVHHFFVAVGKACRNIALAILRLPYNFPGCIDVTLVVDLEVVAPIAAWQEPSLLPSMKHRKRC